MRELTPDECARKWGITRKEVMRKVYNTLTYNGSAGPEQKLPPGFKVRRIKSDNYIITVPDKYRFRSVKPKAAAKKKKAAK